MRQRTLLRLASALVVAGSIALAAGARAEPISLSALHVAMPFETMKLANGLDVIFHEDHRTPIVSVNIWYHVGSKDEPQGRNGFAHLFEHLMFQGSRNVGEDQFFKYLEHAGASEHNGTTNSDRTNYFETLPANELALALWLESDRMGTLLDHVDQKTFESQREVVKNERRQNYENAPYGLVGQYVNEALFPPGHPYHLLTIGTPRDLDAATLDDVRLFFKTFYVPNNATLVVAGDFDLAAAKGLVQKYFGPIPRGADPAVKTKPVSVALAGEKRLDVEAEVELPRILVAWPTPPLYAPDDAELDLVANVLAAGKSSRLYARLVHDLEVAQDVSANQSSSFLASQFSIVVTVRKDKKPEAVLAVIDEELAKLRAAAPTADEVERARTRHVSGSVYRLESVGARANLLNQYAQIAHDPQYLEKDLGRYAGLGPADVVRAATTWLPKDKRVVAIVRPTAGAPRAGRLVP